MLDFIVGLAQVALLVAGITLALYAFMLHSMLGITFIKELFEKKEENK
tara:strand:- start:315 stop:458 length:144 start_codon:yes stop_codon:yes gene_type:complete